MSYIDYRSFEKSGIQLSGRNRLNDLKNLGRLFFMYLKRNNGEYGGWGLDDKRPFGNSDVEAGILEFLEVKPKESCRHCGDTYSELQTDYATSLYNDLGPFLKNLWYSMTDTDCE